VLPPDFNLRTPDRSECARATYRARASYPFAQSKLQP
jgi:hypothetical protein